MHEIYFESKSGSIDVKAVTAFLRKLPFVYQDPANRRIFLLSSTKEGRDYHRKWLRNPESDLKYPWSSLVEVRDDSVGLAVVNELEQCKQIAKWLIEHYDMKITDDYGTDFTEQAKKDVDIIFKG